MAYTPTTWITGDTITAAKLNHLEQGLANFEPEHPVVVAVSTEDGDFTRLNKTWQEISDCFANKKIVFIFNFNLSENIAEIYYVKQLYIDSNHYYIDAGPIDGAYSSIEYHAGSAADYPTRQIHNIPN